MDEHRATAPHRCGLAIALPLSREEVEAALAGGPYRDYVGRNGAVQNAKRLWNGTFADVAQAATELAGSADRLGVQVVMRATLADLGGLLAKCDVVTVVAHWRGAALSPRDLRIAPSVISERILTQTTPFATALRAGLPQHWFGSADAAGSDRRFRSRLAELLDQRLRGQPFLMPCPDGVPWHVDAVSLHHMNRDALDAAWPDAFEPGNRLELADGLHAPNALGRSVPPQWSGIVDLSNCMSAQLVSAIKQGHPERSVICNEGATDPLTRLPVLTALYGMLAREPINYIDARFRLATVLRSAARARLPAHGS